MRLPSRVLPIESLISEVGEKYGAILHGKGAAAVFMRESEH